MRSRKDNKKRPFWILFIGRTGAKEKRQELSRREQRELVNSTSTRNKPELKHPIPCDRPLSKESSEEGLCPLTDLE